MTTANRAQAALLTLQRDREELQATFRKDDPHPRGDFPRSATFRWITGHLNMRSLASTAVTAVLFRPSLLQLVASFVQAKRAGRKRSAASHRRTRH